VFRHSRILGLVGGGAALLAALWLVYWASTRNAKPLYFFAAMVLLFLLMMKRFITARFRPSNWLVRANDHGFFLQLRSYLNYQFPPDDLTVVFIDYSEIRSARLIRERVQTPDPSRQNTTQTQFLRYVELELAGDFAPLQSALDAESSEPAPQEKRWYGTSSTEYQDHPVRMESPPFLRIRWQVVPGPKRFLELLRPYTTIAEPVSLHQDFDMRTLRSLSVDQQRARLREMAQRGNTIAATYTARKLYGCSLGEAKDMIDSLRTGSAG
jgi:hypothetical protein